ncbi:hypothetical protein [Neochlamydia sp. EPS4]|nr:hypothetical protein [Neochlamydia sp. EPS4]
MQLSIGLKPGVKRHDKLTSWRHELLTPTSGRRHQQLTPSRSKIYPLLH